MFPKLLGMERCPGHREEEKGDHKHSESDTLACTLYVLYHLTLWDKIHSPYFIDEEMEGGHNLACGSTPYQCQNWALNTSLYHNL